MKNNSAIIIGGTGQFGIILGKILKQKKFEVYITTRFQKKVKSFKKKYPTLKFKQLNIYKKKKIKSILNKTNPDLIFYFAGQSSPQKSFLKKKETFNSNYIGCKNILSIIRDNKINVKFINATSSEMYGHVKERINIKTVKKPLNPYGQAKKKSFEIVKLFREKYKMKNYNAILFNSESFLRNKNFLIAKICLAAIKAYKFKKKTSIRNISISREWNWCEEQCNHLVKFITKKPQDFILSNGKSFTIKELIIFAFNYFNLDYRNFIKVKNPKLKKNEVKIKRSKYLESFRKNNIKIKYKIYGKEIIHKMIKFYLNEEKI